ncbi:MAG: dockerin type I domain-containing protein [Oscillospiraceae bacterium]|nr:dockerin type I domain-containing protein [Oscillospiraceae bacterium]
MKILKNFFANFMAIVLLVQSNLVLKTNGDDVGFTLEISNQILNDNAFSFEVLFDDIPKTGINVIGFSIAFDDKLVFINEVSEGEISKRAFIKDNEYVIKDNCINFNYIGIDNSQTINLDGVFCKVSGYVKENINEFSFPHDISFEIIPVLRTNINGETVSNSITFAYMDFNDYSTVSYMPTVINGSIIVENTVSPSPSTTSTTSTTTTTTSSISTTTDTNTSTATLTTTSAISSTTSIREELVGDINSDKIVNIVDLVTMVKICSQKIMIHTADLNNDKTINVFDIMLLKRILMRQVL